jgi:hypothetical protein
MNRLLLVSSCVAHDGGWCLFKQVISLHNVGGVVRRGSLVVGLPLDAWKNAKHGLVPATQSMRLAIAEELMAEDERKRAP